MAFAQTRAATATTLSVSEGGSEVTSIAAGTVVTLTAQVTAGGSNVSPGQVNFCDASAAHCTDIHLLAAVQLTSAGTATYKFRPGIGSHSYKAVFLGTNRFAGSVANESRITVTGTIPQLGTATTIDQSGSWGTYTLSATVTETGNTAPPTGSVQFLDTNHGNAVLGASTLGAATRGVTWSAVSTSAPNLAGVTTQVADLNGDGIPDLFIKDYFGTYDVLLGKGDGTFTIGASAFGPTSQTGTFVIGDFNNDGIPDVAAIDATLYAANNSITILLGNGDGTFTVAGASPAVGMNPSGITVGDFNGDGNADLAFAQEDSSGNGYIVILFGNGDGTFTQAPTATPTPGVAASVIAADINNDGHMDLVLSGEGQAGTTILLGKGDGTFAVVAGPTGSGAYTVSVADLNNDGFPDLVFEAAANSYVSVYLGNGDGTFTAAPAGPTSTLRTGNIQVGDFNQDGIPDIAYAVPGTTGVGVLFGKGDGTFVPSSALTGYSYDFSGDFEIADFNGDGWPDVLVVDGSGRKVEDALTQPNETASASATISIATAGSHLADASYAGDANYAASASGTIPLWGPPPATTTTLAITSGGNTVSSVPSGTVVTLSAQVMSGGARVTAGQVNFCDGSAPHCSDIHLLGSAALDNAGTATFRFVPGTGAHSYQAQFVEDGYGLASSSTVASLNVGPAKSIVYTDSAAISAGGFPGAYSLTATVNGFGGTAAPTGSVSFLDASFGNSILGTASLGPSTAGLGWLINGTTTFGSNPDVEVTGDFNGDGIPDIAVLWSNSSYGGPYSVTIFTGKGDGAFNAGTTVSTGIGDQIYPDMIAGDLNGDGKTDLAILSWNTAAETSYITALLGNGDGTFGLPLTSVAFAQGPVGGDGVPGALAVADFNGDGKLDLAVVGDYISSGGVSILLGNGDGTFKAGTVLAPDKDFGQVATGDFNGDGIPDLVVTNYFEYGSGPTILLGKGDGTFIPKSTAFTLDYFPTSVVAADFNGDGILDLAFADLSGVEIALGNGDGTFTETNASPIVVPSELLSLQVGDFNHDGKVDLAGLDNYNDRIVLLLGAGDGTFTVTATTPAVSTSFDGPLQIAAADFNGDGVPDLAMVTKNVNTASILLTEPTETATATVNNIAPLGAGTHNVEASYAGDSNYSSVTSSTVALTAALAPLVVTPAQGTYTSQQTLTISESVPGSTIYYELAGVTHTNGFVPYTGPISLPIGGSVSLEAYATETGYQQSAYLIAQYVLNYPAAPTPALSLATGSYPGTQNLTISDSVAGATIYYTTDGSIPTLSSAVYTGPLTVSASEVFSATAIANGYSMSGAATAQYWIGSSPGRFIYTVAGTGFRALMGDGGPAVRAALNIPTAVALDAAGSLYIADFDNSAVRKVAAGTGIITTVAGTGTPGYSGDNGPATKAQLSAPSGLAIDASGNLYVADDSANVVREIAAGTGIITTVAGTGTPGYTGDGGPATAAELNYPWGLAIDSGGNLYIGTQGAIREVAAGTGTITTFAGNGSAGYSGDNGPATAATIGTPSALVFDAQGNLFFVDFYESVVRKIAAKTQTITTVAGNVSNPSYPTLQGDGGPATSARLFYPEGLAVDSAGDLFIADTGNNALREVTATDGIVNSIAGGTNGCNKLGGDGGPASGAMFCEVGGLAIDSSGNIYAADFSTNRVREITAPVEPPSGATAAPTLDVAAGTYPSPQTVTISDTTPGAQIYLVINGTAVNTNSQGYHGPLSVSGSATLQAIAVAPGYLPSAPVTGAYTITTRPSLVISTIAGTGAAGSAGNGGPATQAEFEWLDGLATDSAGDLYAVDQKAGLVWEINHSTGVASIVAGGGPFSNVNLGDGGLATNTSLSLPRYVAVDHAGNLYIADTSNRRIRKVSAQTGLISTYAGGGPDSPSHGDGGLATVAYLMDPLGLAIDAAGNLYIADIGTRSVRMVSAATGIITTVAGGGSKTGDGIPAVAARLAGPMDLAVDGSGNLYILDSVASRVRMVAANTGIITTLAGNGSPGEGGDGGPATNAQILAEAIAVDASGNLYISNGHEIRMVPAGGGNITSIVGTGYPGFGGDGGAASMAELGYTMGIAFDPLGNLYIADEGNGRIREVAPPGQTSPPVFSLPAGTYTGAQTLSISDSTPGASIYYTTDGTPPTTASNLYSNPISIGSSETVSAIAVATGYAESTVTSAAYVIQVQTAPAVTISGVSPAFASMGGSAFTLTVTGSGFLSTSTVYWGTIPLTTRYASANQLSAQVPASDIASAGVSAIKIQNTSSGVGSSNAFEFEVDSATSGSTTPPGFTTVTATVAPGSTATFSVKLPSSSTNVSVTCLNLPTGATCSYSSSAGAVTITTASTTPAGTYQITIVFTETLPEISTATILLPILLLPLAYFRRRLAPAVSTWVVCTVILLATAALFTGCGGGGNAGGGGTGGGGAPQTHTVTSSGSVTLTVQ